MKIENTVILYSLIISVMVSISTFIINEAFFKAKPVTFDSFVVVDPVKIVNAQKGFLMKNLQTNNGGFNDEVFSLGDRTALSIKNISNGRIVLIKQSVISADVLDITSDVLKEMGLPLDSPGLDLESALKNNAINTANLLNKE